MKTFKRTKKKKPCGGREGTARRKRCITTQKGGGKEIFVKISSGNKRKGLKEPWKPPSKRGRSKEDLLELIERKGLCFQWGKSHEGSGKETSAAMESGQHQEQKRLRGLNSRMPERRSSINQKALSAGG